MIKKLALFILSSFLILNSLALPMAVSAAPGDPPKDSSSATGGSWYNSDFQDWYAKVSDESNPSEIFGERYTSAQVEWVIYGVFAFFINHLAPPGTAGNCIGGDITSCATGVKKYFDSLKTGDAGPSPSLASVVFADRPFSGISYVRNTIKNFSLVPVANAQTPGFGFKALEVIQGMWKQFRDIAFGLFVIVAVVFAFMIMFRVKLSPQVVISVQSALPKIIIALILVTFSYAIAGFLIDIMYIVIGLVSLVMAPLIPNVPLLQPNNYQPGDVFKLLTLGQSLTIPNVPGGIWGLLALYVSPLVLLLVILMGLGFLSSVIPIVGGVGLFFGFLFLVLFVVVMIIILWISIKTIWGLFKAFANIVLLTIFAPVQLVMGALIPNFGFGQWVRNYFSNLSVFVVTGVLWLLAWIFSILAWKVAFTDIPSLTFSQGSGSPWPPLLGIGNFGTGLLMVGVSFVLFTIIPKATELVQSFLSGKPFTYGTSIGELTGPAGTIYTGYAGGQLARGAIPAPFNRIPGVNRWWRGLPQEQREGVAGTVENLTKTRR